MGSPQNMVVQDHIQMDFEYLQGKSFTHYLCVKSWFIFLMFDATSQFVPVISHCNWAPLEKA